MSRKPRSKTLTEQEEAMNKSIRSYNSDEDEDVSISSFPPSRPIKRRRRILLGVSDDDDSPPKKRKSSPPAEGSPVIDLCEESQSGDAGKEEHEESKSVVHQLQDVEPASHENNENEIQDAQLHAEEEKTSVRSGAPSRVNRDDGMVPNQIDIPESFRRESVGHQTASNNQGSVSEASSRSMVPSRSDTQPGFPQDNIFLSEVGENRTWNDLLERFYKMVEARGPLDLKTIKESDSELADFEDDLMSTAKINVLLKAHFKFKKEDDSDETWEKNMTLLFRFHQVHGHTRVPVDTEFGKWVERQRMKGYHGRLPTKRYLCLHALNFQFDPNHMRLPLRVTSIPHLPRDMDVFDSNDTATEEVLAAPRNGVLSRLLGSVWWLLAYIAVLSLLMVCTSFTMAAGVGVFMGIPFLRGSIDAPKLYAQLHLYNL